MSVGVGRTFTCVWGLLLWEEEWGKQWLKSCSQDHFPERHHRRKKLLKLDLFITWSFSPDRGSELEEYFTAYTFFYPKVWIHRDCTDGGIFKCSDAAGFVGCAVLNSSWEPLILWFQDEQRDKRELSVGEIQQKVKEYNSLINTNLHMLVVSDCSCLQSTAFQNDLVTFLTLHICPPGRKKTASSPVSSRCTFS